MSKRLSLQWTTEPKENGFYFAIPKLRGGATWIDKPVPTVVEVDDESIFMLSRDYAMKQDDFTHWLGPLPVPEPPGT